MTSFFILAFCLAHCALAYKNLAPCRWNPCRGNGRCQPNPRGSPPYLCHCNPGWQGPTCQQPIRPTGCNPRCQNGGTCMAQFGHGNVCQCPRGYGGHRCETRIGGPPAPPHGGNPCDGRPCQNGGVCHKKPALPQGYFCNCKYDWDGYNCERWVGRPFDCRPDGDGDYKDPRSCPASHFFKCAAGQGWLFRCDVNTFYDENLGACTWRNQVRC